MLPLFIVFFNLNETKMLMYQRSLKTIYSDHKIISKLFPGLIHQMQSRVIFS